MKKQRNARGTVDGQTPEIALKAVEFLADVTKLLISLSTGVLAFTVTFVERRIPATNMTESLKKGLTWMWLAEGVSVTFGLILLLILTGQLGKGTPDIYAFWARIVCLVQLVAFGLGAFCLLIVGRRALGRR